MIIIGIILFGLLVVVHELGHFVAARRVGVEVEEFGIGFPPKLAAKKYGKTLYSLNLIPLGGFVRLKGESDADRRPGSFGAASFWQKTKILLAGVVMNVVAVFVIVLVLAWMGLPEIVPNQFSVRSNEVSRQNQVVVAQVQDGSPAAQIKLSVGDSITAINQHNVANAQQLRDVTAEFSGQIVDVIYLKDGTQQQSQVELSANEDEGYLGIVPIDITKLRYSWAAPIVAAGVTLQLISLTLLAIVGLIGSVITGGGREAAETVTGPVGVFFLLNNVGTFGFSFLLLLIASISASLAVINGLPIPALDGGKLAVIAAYKALRKKLNPRVENAIHGAGFVALIGLILLISYIDVRRFF